MKVERKMTLIKVVIRLIINVLVMLQTKGRREKDSKKKNWVNNVKEPSSLSVPSLPRPIPKPVDEDLYKISPELLYAKARKVNSKP